MELGKANAARVGFPDLPQKKGRSLELQIFERPADGMFPLKRQGHRRPETILLGFQYLNIIKGNIRASNLSFYNFWLHHFLTKVCIFLNMCAYSNNSEVAFFFVLFLFLQVDMKP